MPSLHLKWASYLLAAAFMIGIAGNVSAATNPMTLKDLSQIVLGLKKEVDRLSKENKTLSKKLERIETQRYAAHTPSSAYQIGNPERLMKARLSEPVQVASLGTARVAEKSSKKTKAKELENRITALEKKSHSEIRPYVRYDLAFGDADMSLMKRSSTDEGQPDLNGAIYPISFGFGIRLSRSLRTDITMDYYSKNLSVPGSNDDNAKLTNLFILGNAYYDFPSIASFNHKGYNIDFVPYIGGGLGFSHYWGNIYDHSGAAAKSLSGAAMAGLNFRLWRGISADIGYRYAHLGFFKYRDSLNVDDDQRIRLQRHDFRMGLRYAF